MTFPDVMRGRRIIHFIDNTTALVHGYANAPDMAAMINMLHLADAALEVHAWYEWVPSAANVSDLQSREAATWSAADAEMMARVRAKDTHEQRRLRGPPLEALQDMRAAAEHARRLVA